MYMTCTPLRPVMRQVVGASDITTIAVLPMSANYTSHSDVSPIRDGLRLLGLSGTLYVVLISGKDRGCQGAPTATSGTHSTDVGRFQLRVWALKFFGLLLGTLGLSFSASDSPR